MNYSYFQRDLPPFGSAVPLNCNYFLWEVIFGGSAATIVSNASACCKDDDIDWHTGCDEIVRFVVKF